MKKLCMVLTGPTAVGKTKLSLALAHAVNGSVISADSMQVYRGMDVGSAKILPEEMEGIPHYLVDVLEPEQEFHVARFQKMAFEAMEDIYSQGRIPIITGGTGFYIQALLKNVDFSESSGASPIRAELEKERTRRVRKGFIKSFFKKIRRRRGPSIPTTAKESSGRWSTVLRLQADL